MLSPGISQSWSSETLTRGVGLIRSATMSIGSDPDKEGMLAELARLEAAKLNSL